MMSIRQSQPTTDENNKPAIRQIAANLLQFLVATRFGGGVAVIPLPSVRNEPAAQMPVPGTKPPMCEGVDKVDPWRRFLLG